MEDFSHFLNLLQKMELVLENGLKAGVCVQGHRLGHSSVDLWVRNESGGGCGNSTEWVGYGRGYTSELSCGGVHGLTVRERTARVQPLAC